MTRYFFAKRNYGTTAKIFVLTVNGWLYSEYLRYGILETYKKKVDYRKFQAEVFIWQGGQLIREVGEVEALKIILPRQPNWVESYLSNIYQIEMDT